MQQPVIVLVLLAALAAALVSAPARAAEPPPAAERLQVADAFLELHTGPGRGYPVFHVAARHEFVTLELRHTDWVRVRTDGGHAGWVHRTQLAATLAAAGGSPNFRDVLVADYLARRVELGASWGRFKSEPTLNVGLHWRYAQGLGVALTVGQVQGTFSGSDFWHADLTAEPWAHRRLSPVFAIGVGRFNNVPNASLVAATPVDANLGHAGVGLRWHLSDRFVARADWHLYSAFVADTRSLEYRALTLGLSFFF